MTSRRFGIDWQRVRKQFRDDYQFAMIVLFGLLAVLTVTGFVIYRYAFGYLFGGTVLSGMSFALIFGVVIGTYSSVFVASAILLVLGLDQGEKQRREVEGFQGV